NRFGVTPGRRVAVLTNNDDGLRTAQDLEAKGIDVAAVIDVRTGAGVRDTFGRKRLTRLALNDGTRIAADCLAVSGGWSPNVQLSCHQRGRPVWRDAVAGFVPGTDLPPGMVVCGAANGVLTLARTLADGARAACTVAEDLGKPVRADLPRATDEPAETAPIFVLPQGKARAWVD
ncbi:MAG: sarcosine oxidase subunit alpha, partial [Pseudomonadota bacterium]